MDKELLELKNLDIPNEKKSKYNIGMRWLMSLREILDDCSEYSRLCYMNGKPNSEAINQWKLTLYSARREVNPKMDNTEKKTLANLFNNIEKINHLKITRTPEGSYPSIDAKNFKKKWLLLDTINLKICEYIDMKDMGVPSWDSSKPESDDD
jgi:hypothetical protein